MPALHPSAHGRHLATPDAFLAALRQSRLLTPGQLRESEALLAGRRDPRRLAKALVKRGWLTAWQARRVWRGLASSLTVGPYQLLGRLGRGAGGEVYKARHARMGRLAALKLLGADAPGGVGRFLREAQALARLDHPNVVRAYDAGEVRGTYFLAMEYVEGSDLQRLVEREGPLGFARAAEYARQAALGLQHAHERGVVHRDVKPSNLLLSARGVVKVLDLGLARLRGRADGEPLTAAGQGMGTVDYIAPEQLRDARSADARADLYSLGCTLYFLLTGRPPFAGESAVEKLLGHLHGEPEPLESLRPDVPPALAAVVRRLMAKDPADRFQTPAQLAAALGECLSPGTAWPPEHGGRTCPPAPAGAAGGEATADPKGGVGKEEYTPLPPLGPAFPFRPSPPPLPTAVLPPCPPREAAPAPPRPLPGRGA
jgi:eukaryotic-like serine/threonine-protein kinase